MALNTIQLVTRPRTSWSIHHFLLYSQQLKMCYNGTIAALENKLKIYVEQDIFMHVLAGALQMKRIGNRLEIWIEYVCFSLNCIALVGTIYISYLNGYFGDGRPTGEQGSRLPLLHFQINLDQFWNNVNWTFYNGVAKQYIRSNSV